MNQRVMLTKKLLKESLLNMLNSKNIQQISVKELCMNAGINRSTFYAHYSEPKDVLIEIEKEFAENIIKLVPKDCDISQKERLLILCKFLYEHVDFERILFQNNSDEDIAKWFGYSGFFIVSPEQYLGDDTLADEDREFISVFINYGMYHILRKWLMTDSNKTPDEIASLISRIILK